MDYKQRTLARTVDCAGIGLHSGAKIHLIVHPAPVDSGIRFVRGDIAGRPSVPVNVHNVVETNFATTLASNGCRVATVEHLLAALFGLGIDNAVVEVDGPEVPIMDGSAAPFVFLLRSAGIQVQDRAKRFIVIRRPLEVAEETRSVAVYPSKELRVTYLIDFDHPLIRNQVLNFTFSGGDFIREISKARTFGFLRDVEMLKEHGLARGGSLDNAVVIDEFRILNEDGLRYRDEFVRHKILDFLGDLSVIGSPVIGHFVVKKSGHSLNHRMLQNLVKARRHWKFLEFGVAQGRTPKTFKIPALGTLEPLPA